VLKPQEIAQISLALWYLPLPQLEEVKRLVLDLKAKHGYSEPIDDSDEWTEEDREDFQRASMKRWDEREGTDAADDAAQAG
jgi:hypothetical protein